MKYRWRAGARFGRWCATKREAMLAAVKAGLGSVDEFPTPPGQERRVYLDALVEIEEGVD